MRKTAVAFGFLLCSTFAGSAHADPYRWCAEYGGGEGGASNCYFVTYEQCRAALSGTVDFCRPNTFYTGPSEERHRRRR